MNKLIIGLLIVAAGTGIFFLVRKKQSLATSTTINKELIIGKWKTVSPSAVDSTIINYEYEFKSEGLVLKLLNDSSKVDTSYYKWNKANELTWSTRQQDSVFAQVYFVDKLTTDSLQLRSNDSTVHSFTRAR